MFTFAAVSSKRAKIGSMSECVDWGLKMVQDRNAKIVKIVKARPEDKRGRVIFEITTEGLFRTPYGRLIDLKLVRRAEKDGKE